MSFSDVDKLFKQNFPTEGLSLVFGYGSKVVRQSNYKDTNDLIDIVIVVDDPLDWHTKNLDRNYDHYSWLRRLSNPADRMTKLQENYGGNVYFNPYVAMGAFSIKYGVIRTSQLIEDLNSWNKLYIAGRLHKPVEFIKNTCDKNEALRSAMRSNKESAIRAALLQLPESFDLWQLFTAIVGLSYHGDLRMLFGEDKNKIENIVRGQFDKFKQLYMPIIKLSPQFKESVSVNEARQVFSQDKSSKSNLKHLKLLPVHVKRTICNAYRSSAGSIESDVVLTSVSKSLNCDKIVLNSLMSIVRSSSTSQSFKGLLTAGLLKSARYSQRKLVKSLLSRVFR